MLLNKNQLLLVPPIEEKTKGFPPLCRTIKKTLTVRTVPPDMVVQRLTSFDLVESTIKKPTPDITPDILN